MAGEQGTTKTATKPASVKVFNCPSCGAGVVLRAVGQSVTAVCGSCSAIIDSSNENYQVIEKATKATKRQPLIPLGQRGSLKGVVWEVIGFVAKIDGTGIYSWNEYLLFNPMRGFRWLTEFDGHWNYVLTTKEKPTAHAQWIHGSDRQRRVKYLDKEYSLFHKGTAKVTYVIGEFYWRVHVGETVTVEDYVNPPEILSCETSKDEVIWSLGEYVDAASVRKAFQIKEVMPAQIGVAPNQISTIADVSSYSLKYWGIFLAILFVVQMKALISAKGETVYAGEFSFSPMDTERLRVSPQFELKGGLSNVELTAYAKIGNTWLEVQSDLVNDDNGTVYEIEQGIEYYHGYDSDGAWTEGSYVATTIVSSIPPGRYHLNVEASGPALPVPVASLTNGYQPPLQLRMTVRRDVVTWSNFLWACLFLSAYPIIAWWRNRSFEMSRWSQSDFSPYYSQHDDA